MIIIKKEYRRAKRNKKWLREGNIIPLSTKEIKQIQNKLYREKKKRKEHTIFKYSINYNEDLNDFLTQQDFNHTGCLTYSYNISIDKVYSNSMYIFETLLKRGYLTNYYFLNEYQQHHNHTHYLLTINKDIKDIEGIIYRLLNCTYKVCHNHIKPITCEEYKVNAINYFVEKLEPNFNNFKHKKQLDYWYFNKKIESKELVLCH